ncbi:MAG: SDR family oxidoreductase [Bifidobacteriaceae bacterium]|jgi:glucose 1-dehydrogenase/2-deoxy-D-gluconate 3-dehydrogenase|nr:SDR family oxidoreductase [Bifidobacteriaceae bacterium]
MEPIYSLEQYGKMRGLDIQIATDDTPPLASLVNLTGKAAIVTGGARGLGFHVVNRLAEAGAKVMIVDIATDFAEDAVEFFRNKGADVGFILADIRSTDQIREAVERTTEAYGQIDILVNCAGVMGIQPALEMTEAEWNTLVDVNARGCVFFSQIVARHMVERGIKGKIVNVATNAVEPFASDWFAAELGYVASKAGLIKASEVLAAALAEHGIVVTVVKPGGMRSPGAFLMKRDDRVTAKPTAARPPLAMNPDAVGRVVFALATGLADFATGAILNVDGGSSLGVRA